MSYKIEQSLSPSLARYYYFLGAVVCSPNKNLIPLVCPIRQITSYVLLTELSEGISSKCLK